jgi:hypothetical protein
MCYDKNDCIFIILLGMSWPKSIADIEEFDKDNVIIRDFMLLNNAIHYHVTKKNNTIGHFTKLEKEFINSKEILIPPKDEPLPFIKNLLEVKQVSRPWNLLEPKKWVVFVPEKNRDIIRDCLSECTKKIFSTGKMGQYIKDNIFMFEGGMPLKLGYPYELHCWKIVDVLRNNSNEKIGEELEFSVWRCDNHTQEYVVKTWLKDLDISLDKRKTLVPQFIANWTASKVPYKIEDLYNVNILSDDLPIIRERNLVHIKKKHIEDIEYKMRIKSIVDTNRRCEKDDYYYLLSDK